MTYQWRRLQFFEKSIVSTTEASNPQQSGTSSKPPQLRSLRLFDHTTTSLTSTTSGHGFVFGADNHGFIHRFSRQNNFIDKFQAFDSVCLHIKCVPQANVLIAVGFDHDHIDPMFNPTLKFFKYQATPVLPTLQQIQAQQQALQQQRESGKQDQPFDTQYVATDFTCIRTIPLADYLNPLVATNSMNAMNGAQSQSQPQSSIRKKLITITCLTATDDTNHIALGCDDGSLITIELSKTRWNGNVWFRRSIQGAQPQPDWPVGPITTLHYRPSSTNAYMSLYLTTMSGLHIVHQSRSSLSIELLSPEGCHYHGTSLCFNTTTNTTSTLGEYVMSCPEVTSFYSTEGDRLSCYFFPEHKKYIAFYNHFLIIVSDEGMTNTHVAINNPSGLPNPDGSMPPPVELSPQQQQYNAQIYNSPLSTLTSQVNPTGRNAIIIYDIHSKIIVFSLKCDVIVGLQVLNHIGSSGGNANQICFITQRGEMMVLTELPLRNKMAVLLRRELYTVALSLASSQSVITADKRLIIDITYKYGDYLYNKGDYEAATVHYVNTIGYIEPSIIISKFLHSQRITCLTTYLEALHDNKFKHLITTDHTTLLLTCYTKLRDLKRMTAFLYEKHNLNLISAATPIEHLKSIEYCRVYCNSLQIDFTHLDEISNLTNIGEYMTRVLHSSTQYYSTLNSSVSSATGGNANKDNNNDITSLTTIYTTQHYNTLNIYNIIKVYIECNYYYHALYISLLLGAHEYVVYLLFHLGMYSQVIQYLYSLPINIVIWLLHQYGHQLLREYPQEITLLCIKLVCGWKRQPIIHNMILTIQQDLTASTTTTTQNTNSNSGTAKSSTPSSTEPSSSANTTASLSTECYAQFESVYKYDEETLADHFQLFTNKQNITKQQVAQHEQSRQITTQAPTQSTQASVSGPKDESGSDIIEHHIYLRIMINDDGCTEVLKCIGYEETDLTLFCNPNNSNLHHLALTSKLLQRQPATISEDATPTTNVDTGGNDLSLDDFATDQPTSAAPTPEPANLDIIQEHLYISPSDFIPLFSDSPRYLQEYLDAICAHATTKYQTHDKKAHYQNLQQQQQQYGDLYDPSVVPTTEHSPTAVQIHSKIDTSSLLLLNAHSTITSSFHPMGTSYDYLLHLNGPQSATKESNDSKVVQNKDNYLTHFRISNDKQLLPLMQFPLCAQSSPTTIMGSGNGVGNIINSDNITDGGDLNSLFFNDNDMSVSCVNITTSVMCDNNIWTALIELYAEFIKAANQKIQATTSTTIKSKTTAPATTSKSSKVTAQSSPQEIEQLIIQIIKTNIDHIDYSSIFILLENYGLESSLSFLYARTRQYHSLLHLQTNRLDWFKAKQVCVAYGSQEPSLWLFLLVKIVENYPIPDPSAGPDRVTQDQQVIELLTVAVHQVHSSSLLSPLQILSLLSTSPHIPVDPVRNFLLQIIHNIQTNAQNFSQDATNFAQDSTHVQQSIHMLQYEPLVFKSIDCQRCKQPLTLPTVHFYCGHSFHSHCVIENDVQHTGQGNGNQQYQNNIASIYELIASAQPLMQNDQATSLLLNDTKHNHQQNTFTHTTLANNNNPYSALLNHPSCVTEYASQQLILNMFNQQLEYECPLCQQEHQRLFQLATTLFGTNQDYNFYSMLNDGMEPDPKAKQAQIVQQAQIHDKFLKRLDEHNGQFALIAEQLSRGMYLPGGNE